jgi:hypothetical protein
MTTIKRGTASTMDLDRTNEDEEERRNGETEKRRNGNCTTAYGCRVGSVPRASSGAGSVSSRRENHHVGVLEACCGPRMDSCLCA